MRQFLKIDGHVFSDELSESEVGDLFFKFIQENNLYYVGEFLKEEDYESDSSDI